MNNFPTVAIIGCVGVPAQYGGWETLAQQLVTQLNKEVEFTVACSGPREKTGFFYELNCYRAFYPIRANGISSIFYDSISLIDLNRKANILLVLGTSGAICLPLIRALNKKVIILGCPDGIEWRREKWGIFARYFLKFSEYLMIKFSHKIVCDNIEIQRYIYQRYNLLGELIAYGGDHVIVQNKYLETVSDNYAFTVCRIEPENNIHLILEAFAQITEHKLIIVGNWDYSTYGKNLRKKYKKFKQIQMLDPIYDQVELDKLRANATIYVHGHSAGGTNPSLVEAMYLGLPIVAFDCEFNRRTTDDMCVYFSSSSDLKNIIRTLSPKDWENIAVACREYAINTYNWKSISEKYLVIFKKFFSK